jgi:hypothetical protein
MENATYFKLIEYNEYLEFIRRCRTKLYDDNLVLHLHHIIPKHLWYNTEKSVNSMDNLVSISVENHIKAHLLLANCYDDGTYESNSNLRSARILNKKSIINKSDMDKISQTYIGENNPFYGKKHTDETKKILAQSTKKFYSGKTYEELYGDRADAERQKRSKKTRTDEQYRESGKKTSKKLKGLLVGDRNGFSQQYMVDGLIFGCRGDMLTHFNMSMYYLKKQKNIIYISKEEYSKLKNK